MATSYGHNETAPESLGSFISNSRQIVIALAVLLCAVAGYSVVASRNSAKADAGRNALYLAEKSRETENKALLPATPAPAAPAAGKAAAPTAPSAGPEVTYKKLDVDATFPETLKKLRAVTKEYSGTRSAFDSQMAIGELYFNHGAPDKALAEYQQAVDRAPSSFEKALALSSVGYARENAGQLKEALEAFDKALNIGDPGLKGDLWMGKARVYTALKDSAQAKTNYDQIISQLPNTNYAKYAEIYKSRWSKIQLKTSSGGGLGRVILFSCISFGIAVAFVLSGCSGRDIHADLRNDPKIMVRDWTLSTHGPFDAGDRGTEFSNPVLVENALVFGNRSVGLISIYPQLNQQRWALPIKGGVASELAVSGPNVFFGGGDGFLYSVALDDGRVNWRYDIRNPVISRPTVVNGRVFVTTSDDTVYAFDAGTGKWLWHYRRRSSPTATIYGASAPLVDGAEVLAGLSDGFMVALSTDDGQLKWERKLHQGVKFTDVDAHPLLENGVVYEPSYDGALYALKRANGEVIWRFDAGGSKDVVLDGARLILPSSDGSIYALNKANSKVLWKFELDHGTPTQVVVTDRYVVVGSSFQYVYVIDKETGKGLYRYNVGYDTGFSGSPVYDPVRRRVYFLSHGGNLYAFRLRKTGGKHFAHGQTDGYESLQHTASVTPPRP